jgi:hypothetical protein
MNRRNAQLVEHQEGDGRLLAEGRQPLPVRFVLDTWQETIATGSGTCSEIQRRDGFVWWKGEGLGNPAFTLETADGHRFRVALFDHRSNRAHFCCVG